jgi:MFS family permease
MAQNPSSHSFSDKMLFWASFFTLIVSGMGTSIRTDIIDAWGAQFSFTQTELGTISGMGFIGFGLTIIVFSFFADLMGYGKLMVIAFLLHLAAVGTTLAAPYAYHHYGKDGAYWCLYIGQLCFSLANGTCEAVINPLTATLFPNNKTHWLNILHAGWPGGLVLGALVSLGLNQVPGGVEWPIRWGIVLAPVLLYGVMMVGRRFPRSEAKESGIPLRQMMGVVGFLGMAVVTAMIGLYLSQDLFPSLKLPWLPPVAGWGVAVAIWLLYGFVTSFSPGHIILAFLYILHALIGYVELGTDNWIVNITKTVLASPDKALMAFIWTNVLMFTLRFFAGPIVHRISPLGLLFCSATLGALGLWLLGRPETNETWTWMGAVTVYGIGKTFYWPTMLGVISERYPQGGALALGISGGVGMISAGLLGAPVIGYKQDYAAVQYIEQSAPDTYQRYKSDEAKAPLDALPKVAGLDNAKVDILKNHMAIQDSTAKGATAKEEDKKLKIERDLELLAEENRKDEALEKRWQWWVTQGRPHAEEDWPRIKQTQLHGGKTALTWTAAVPAALAVGYLLLILVFKLQGGYRQIHLTGPGEH